MYYEYGPWKVDIQSFQWCYTLISRKEPSGMKKLAVLLVTIIMCFALAACGNNTPQEIVSKELGVDVSSSIEISDADTHGGFHGDGYTFIALRFDDNSVLDAIKKDSKWQEFPLDETMQALVYGLDDEASKIGPFLSDEQGNALVPEIQNGYYYLIDRHTETNTDILERDSFNFTVGIYDADNNIMYFCKLDT